MASVVSATDSPGDWPQWLINRIKNDPTGIDQQWTGGWHLGDGAAGLASLWIAFDETSNSAIDRMVVKVEAISHGNWWDPTKWSDGINAIGHRNFAAPINHNQPQEAIILQRSSTLAVPPAAGARRHPLSRYRGRTPMDMQNRRWKLFMDFCPYGPLHEIIAYHRAQQIFLPEPFIWYVGEQLLFAVQVMRQGGTDANRVPTWRGLIHRDIKPGNVFPLPANRQTFQHYPEIQLGDFGFTCETDVNDPNNPIEFFEDEGTPGFLPPEQRRWYKKNADVDLSRKRKLQEQTNVWGVGMIMW